MPVSNFDLRMDPLTHDRTIDPASGFELINARALRLLQ